MWNTELWEEERDFCDRAEEQKREIFNLAMTQTVHALGKQWAVAKFHFKRRFAMLNKKEWMEKGDYLDEQNQQRERVFYLSMNQTVASLKI